jgi:hypothetical protein
VLNGIPIGKIARLEIEYNVFLRARLDMDTLKTLEFELRSFDRGTKMLDIHLNDFIAGTLARIPDSHSYLDLAIGLRAG